MNGEIRITEVEAQKINLQEGDVLMVTVGHEDIDQGSLQLLHNKFKSAFPNNEVMVFGMGTEGYVKFAVVKQEKISYCGDCGCGKKERALAQEKKNDQP